MSSIIRSISLDEQTAVIAKSIPNFSRFVRECLLRYHAVDHEGICPTETIEGQLTHDLCVPAPGRLCLKHWPHGNPTLSDWKIFREMMETPDHRLYDSWPQQQLSRDEFRGTKEERKHQWIQHMAKLHNPAKIEFAGMVVEGNAPKRSKSKDRRSAIRRLRAFLASK